MNDPDSTRTPLVAAPPLLALLAALAGCNGGDSQGMAAAPMPQSATPSSVPAGALASVPAFIGFVAELAPDETHEPLSVASVAPPLSDSDEPQAI
ncbi:MAG TPA: hypothetical protein VH109_00245 [Steroidobacteraceae bacterium]|jgi:hypothetical protein|nr:hypothetical protein [Steroidobacteraceae bacterium]